MTFFSMTEVFIVGMRFEKLHRHHFNTLTDTGTPSSAVDLNNLSRIRHGLEIQNKRILPWRNGLSFAVATYRSLGRLVLPIDVSLGVPSITVTFYIVNPDITAPLGLEVTNAASDTH